MQEAKLKDKTWLVACTLQLKKKYIRELALVCVSSSFLLREGLHIQIVPPQFDIPRSLTVKRASMRGDDLLVWFEEVSSTSLLQEYDEKMCLITIEQSEDLERVEDASLEGWQILGRDATVLGQIVSVEEMPSQKLITIKKSCGAEVLLPLIDDFVFEVDEDLRTIVLDLPDYLLAELA